LCDSSQVVQYLVVEKVMLFTPNSEALVCFKASEEINLVLTEL
jgi:hypothetical protein